MQTELTLPWGEPVLDYPAPATRSARCESVHVMQPPSKVPAQKRNPWRARTGMPWSEALLAGIVAAGMLAIEFRIFAVALLG